jgi:hypothetical protein
MRAARSPSSGVPTDTFLEGRRRKYHNDEGVEVFYEPNAITDGDTIVHFRRSDVIVTGEILTTTQYPFIDINHGGSIRGEIAALNNIPDKTIYKHEGEVVRSSSPAAGGCATNTKSPSTGTCWRSFAIASRR